MLIDFSFGAGEKEVNFVNVHLQQEKKEGLICDSHWVLIDGVCVRDCHEECKETFLRISVCVCEVSNL